MRFQGPLTALEARHTTSIAFVLQAMLVVCLASIAGLKQVGAMQAMT